jgi:uncharacterized protein (TIGR02996 family)
VTEDEAFIRAIVDSPGDDTPRLVYADWLDDRDDPRGPYLRAELEIVNSLRSGGTAPILDKRDELAIGLDSVWVARISRPPIGVCCEHLRFDESGPRLTVDALDEVRRWRRVQFPAAYTAFLLNYNGGRPTLPGFAPPRLGDTGFRVGWFFPFGSKSNLRDPGTLCSEVHRYWNDRLPAFLDSKSADYEDEMVNWYHDFIPIADAPNESVSVMLGVYGHYRGRVQLVNWGWTPGWFSYAESDVVGGSLARLLALITPDTGE